MLEYRPDIQPRKQKWVDQLGLEYQDVTSEETPSEDVILSWLETSGFWKWYNFLNTSGIKKYREELGLKNELW